MTDADRAQALDRIMALSPVIAVVTVTHAHHAVKLAHALVAGGIKAIEVTLRTPAAMDAIAAIAGEVPDAVTGAGTCLTPAQIDAAAKAGAAFAVSPGSPASLLAAARGAAIPLLPGTASATEIMAALEAGYSRLKFFPAEPIGGAAALGALAAPLPAAIFCPTGGITAANAPAYLRLPNVTCVGGSWMAPAALVEAERWDEITALARAAAALAR